MFEQLDEREEKQEETPTDYTGLKILGVLAPVFLFFIYIGKAEMGFAASLVLGMIILAIKFQWRMRRHFWFWATIALILALHIPLILIARVPDTKTPIIAISMPIGILDFLIISGALRLAESLFAKGSSSEDDAE